MTREFTCIICPNGCEISADYEIQADQSVVIHSLGRHLQKRSRVCKTGADRSEEKHCNLRTGRRRRTASCQCTPYCPDPQGAYFRCNG